MPENEPSYIKIEIPVEEEPPLFQPDETARGGSGQRLGTAARQAAAQLEAGARTTYAGGRAALTRAAESQAMRAARRGARRGASRGLRWLAGRLASLADRLGKSQR